MKPFAWKRYFIFICLAAGAYIAVRLLSNWDVVRRSRPSDWWGLAPALVAVIVAFFVLYFGYGRRKP